MARPLAGQSVQEFRHITEQHVKGRRRLRSEAIPEIVAWLTTRIILAQEKLHRHRAGRLRSSSGVQRAYIESLESEIDMLNDLIACVADEWPKSDWDEAVVRVARALGVNENRPLPKAIRDMSLIAPMGYEYDGIHGTSNVDRPNPTR